MIKYFIGILIMTLLGAVASLFLKKASGANGVISLIMNVNLYIGAFLYLASAILNIWVLRYLDYSIVLPLTSLTYVWTIILSYLVLKEKITWKKIEGIVLILVGIICISQ